MKSWILFVSQFWEGLVGTNTKWWTGPVSKHVHLQVQRQFWESITNEGLLTSCCALRFLEACNWCWKLKSGLDSIVLAWSRWPSLCNNIVVKTVKPEQAFHLTTYTTWFDPVDQFLLQEPAVKRNAERACLPKSTRQVQPKLKPLKRDHKPTATHSLIGWVFSCRHVDKAVNPANISSLPASWLEVWAGLNPNTEEQSSWQIYAQPCFILIKLLYMYTCMLSCVCVPASWRLPQWVG